MIQKKLFWQIILEIDTICLQLTDPANSISHILLHLSIVVCLLCTLRCPNRPHCPRIPYWEESMKSV